MSTRAEIFEHIAEEIGAHPVKGNELASFWHAKHGGLDGFTTFARAGRLRSIDMLAITVARLSAAGIEPARLQKVIRKQAGFSLLAVYRRISELRTTGEIQ